MNWVLHTFDNHAALMNLRAPLYQLVSVGQLLLIQIVFLAKQQPSGLSWGSHLSRLRRWRRRAGVLT